MFSICLEHTNYIKVLRHTLSKCMKYYKVPFRKLRHIVYSRHMLSTPNEVSVYAERIHSIPDESHMLCIFLPLPSCVPDEHIPWIRLPLASLSLPLPNHVPRF